MDRALSTPLFAQVLGREAFARLPAPVRAVHWVQQRQMPARWFERVRCREHADAWRYGFLVDVRLPLVGAFIRYEGWLELR
ncbi:DUF4166 domain-containing protein [Xanthomonas nasturtii]|uniref:DUF4166 domain-containing protein n=1 Tax=Xanthomonas nasturtii TaxID=1843581 RepID=A0A3E1KGW8_9XANT|nr:DUF4166 domain-containing protein [Xanthomonas nasturtii]